VGFTSEATGGLDVDLGCAGSETESEALAWCGLPNLRPGAEVEDVETQGSDGFAAGTLTDIFEEPMAREQGFAASLMVTVSFSQAMASM